MPLVSVCLLAQARWTCSSTYSSLILLMSLDCLSLLSYQFHWVSHTIYVFTVRSFQVANIPQLLISSLLIECGEHCASCPRDTIESQCELANALSSASQRKVPVIIHYCHTVTRSSLNVADLQHTAAVICMITACDHPVWWNKKRRTSTPPGRSRERTALAVSPLCSFSL